MSLSDLADSYGEDYSFPGDLRDHFEDKYRGKEDLLRAGIAGGLTVFSGAFAVQQYLEGNSETAEAVFAALEPYFTDRHHHGSTAVAGTQIADLLWNYSGAEDKTESDNARYYVQGVSGLVSGGAVEAGQILFMNGTSSVIAGIGENTVYSAITAGCSKAYSEFTDAWL